MPSLSGSVRRTLAPPGFRSISGSLIQPSRVSSTTGHRPSSREYCRNSDARPPTSRDMVTGLIADIVPPDRFVVLLELSRRAIFALRTGLPTMGFAMTFLDRGTHMRGGLSHG